MTTVLVAAPSAVVRAGLESILAGYPSIEVVGQATGRDDLADQVERFRPDVVLIEQQDARSIGMLPFLPDGAGPPAFVVLTPDPEVTDLAAALGHGGRAVLPRNAEPREIVAAVEAAAAGLVTLHPVAASLLVPVVQGAVRPPPATGTEPLTPREREVLGMLAEGAGNKQIARRLGISEHTVKFHVGSILAKLGAVSRTEAVTIGVRQGLIMV